MYEIGALVALDELIAPRGLSIHDFDLYVGTSAGAFVATMLAGGMRLQRFYRAVLDNDTSILQPRRGDVYRFELDQGLGIARDVGRVLLSLGRRSYRERRLLPPGEVIADLLDALPAGIFSLHHFEHYLDRFLRHHGLPRRMGQLRRELYITANDLDSGHRAVFGAPGPLEHAPLATAICASSAIPLFFMPVRYQGRDFVDGAVGKVAHADLALHRGAELVVIVNPLVPFQNDPTKNILPSPLQGSPFGGRVRHMRDKGLLAVYAQAGKMSTHTKLQEGVRRARAAWPKASLMLVEPRETESELFLDNPMGFDSHARLVRYGYESTKRLLVEEHSAWERAIERHLTARAEAG